MTSIEYFYEGEKFLSEYEITSDEEHLQLALTNYNKAIKLQADYANAIYKRSVVYGHLEEYNHKVEDLLLAIQIYNNKISEDKVNPELHYRLALVHKDNYNDNKYLEKARYHFDEALKQGYNNSNIYFEIGKTYEDFPGVNAEIALNYYNKAIELDPNISEYYLARGDCYDTLKMQECALTDFNIGIGLNPKESMFYNRRGELYLQRKEWDKAKNDYIEFRKTYPFFSKTCPQESPKIKLFKNHVGGPFFEFYFAEDLSKHHYNHPKSSYLEDCIFDGFINAFDKHRVQYYGDSEFSNEELKTVLTELKSSLNRMDSLRAYQDFFEYMVSCKFIYTLVRDFDEYENQWETILKDFKEVNNHLISLISEAISKKQKLFLFGI